MFKKIASIALAAAMLTSAAAIAASAADTDEAVGAVEDSALGADESGSELGAEAGDTVAAGNTLSFDANTAGWKNYKKVFCYIWEYGGSAFADFGAKETKCSDEDGDGVWTFDLSAAGWNLQSGKEYGVIFRPITCLSVPSATATLLSATAPPMRTPRTPARLLPLLSGRVRTRLSSVLSWKLLLSVMLSVPA